MLQKVQEYCNLQEVKDNAFFYQTVDENEEENLLLKTAGLMGTMEIVQFVHRMSVLLEKLNQTLSVEKQQWNTLWGIHWLK